MKNIYILHVDDCEFERTIVGSMIESPNVNIVESGSLQEYQSRLDANHKFMISIIDGSFPDEIKGTPKLNISRAFDSAKSVGIDIIYILSGEKLETIDNELGPDRKPEGIYHKGTQRKDFGDALRSKIEELTQ